MLWRVCDESGWSLATVLDMTFPELTWFLNKGEKPTPKLANPRDIRAYLAKIRAQNEAAASG